MKSNFLFISWLRLDYYLKLFIIVALVFVFITIHSIASAQTNLETNISSKLLAIGPSVPSISNISKQQPCENSVYYHLHKAGIYETRKDKENAVKEYLKVLELDPQNILAHFNLGLIYYEYWSGYSGSFFLSWEAHKYLDMAEENLLWVQQANPRISVVYFKLGRIYTIQGKNDKAINQYKEALKLSPNNVIFYFNLATLYEDSGDKTLAKYYYTECTRVNKKFPFAFNNLALLNEDEGNDKEAIKLYKAALKADEKYTFSLINLGSLLTKNNKLKDAAVYLTRAVAIDPDNCWAHLHLGYLFEKQEKLELACQEYTTFVQLNPTSPKGYYLLCNIFNKLNKDTEAIAAGIIYLKLEPEGNNADEVHSIIDKLQHNLSKTSSVEKNIQHNK